MAKDDSFPMHNSVSEALPTNGAKTLKTAVDQLTAITKRLSVLASLIAGATLLNMFWAVFVVLISGLATSERLLLGIHAAILLLCLLLLWQYDHSRRAGDSLFEEISDELQRYIAAGQNSGQDGDELANQWPFLHERITLRQYTPTTNLPLSNRQGPIYYALLNIAVTFFVVPIYFGP